MELRAVMLVVEGGMRGFLIMLGSFNPYRWKEVRLVIFSFYLLLISRLLFLYFWFWRRGRIYLASKLWDPTRLDTKLQIQCPHNGWIIALPFSLYCRNPRTMGWSYAQPLMKPGRISWVRRSYPSLALSPTERPSLFQPYTMRSFKFPVRRTPIRP